jgi:hypothetical protein
MIAQCLDVRQDGKLTAGTESWIGHCLSSVWSLCEPPTVTAGVVTGRTAVSTQTVSGQAAELPTGGRQSFMGPAAVLRL